MKKRQSFIKGVLVLAAAGVIVKILGFLYRVVLTNLTGYGDEGNGIYGAGFQIYLVFYALSTTGFPSAISKMVAEKKAVGDNRGAHRIFKVAFWLLSTTGFTLSLLFFLFAPYFARLISNERAVYSLLALAPTIFFASLMAVFRGYFQGMQDMSPHANSQVIEQAGKAVFTIILAYLLLPYGVEYSAAGATFGTTMGAAIGAAYLWNLYGKRKRELWKEIINSPGPSKAQPVITIVRNLLGISVPISLGTLILTASNIIDLATVMNLLEKAGFDSDSANRLYGILTGKCYVLTNFPVALCAALSTSLVPAIAGAVAAGDYKRVSNKILAALRITILIGFPSTVGMALLAGPILKLLFPASSDGGYLLSISAWGIIFMGLTQTLSGILQGLGKPVVPTVSLFIGAVVKVFINLALIPIPHINIKGAVYGTLACYIIATLINIAVLAINFRLNLDIYNFIIKPAAATFFMGVAAYYGYEFILGMTGSNFIAATLSIAGSAGIFGIFVLLFGGIDLEDIYALPFGKNVGEILLKTKVIRINKPIRYRR